MHLVSMTDNIKSSQFYHTKQVLIVKVDNRIQVTIEVLVYQLTEKICRSINIYDFSFLKELGIRVQVNSDAHYPERINNGRAEALAALKKAGFTSVAEWHNGKWEEREIE